MSKITDLKTELANAEQVADADIAALANAARGLLASDFVGVPLKFAKGKWTKVVSKDQTEAIGSTAPFVVDMLSYACGWVKWVNKRPLKFIGRPVDGFILPVRDRLPDREETKWPLDPKGKRKDPWQENHQLVLKDATAEELVTWTTPSWYGRKAVGRLLDVYAHEARKHPGLMPVVLLSSKDERVPDYGDVPAPVLTVTAWRAFGEGAAPPGSPMAPSTMPALEAQPQLILPPASSPPPAKSSGDDMDDMIPF